MAVSGAEHGLPKGNRHPAFTPYGLKEDIEAFIKLIPRAKILNIIIQYLGEDAEVQEAFQYIHSEDFKNVVRDLEAIPEYRKVIKELFSSNSISIHYNVLFSVFGVPSGEWP